MKIIKNKLASNKSSLLVVVGILIVFLLANKSNIDFVKAINISIHDYGWGGATSTLSTAYNGIGWISFASTTDGTPYGVNVPVGDGIISGKAWSENYGWLSFDSTDLAGCAGATPATITGNLITGWARFLSIRDDSVAGNSGGWLGCVSLAGSGTDPANGPFTYGVTSTNEPQSLSGYKGYAWSDELGYIDFSGAGLSALMANSVNLTPLNTTIYKGQSVNFSSSANFIDNSMVAHNINWEVTGSNCWDWDNTCSHNGSTISNASFVDPVGTSTHSFNGSVAFTPAVVGVYSLKSSAQSSPSLAWTDSMISTVNVLATTQCDIANVSSWGSCNANACNTTAGTRTGTCPSPQYFGSVSQSCTATPYICVATPVSVTISSATIHAGDSVAVTWDINNPDSTCHIQASSTDPLSFTDTANLNKIFESFNTPANTDSNDPYGSSRSIQSAIQTDYITHNPSVGHGKGQKTVILNYPTSFTAYCGVPPSDPTYVPTAAKKTIVNVTRNIEG